MTLETTRILLRPMEEHDVAHKVSWVNDESVRRTLNFDYPLSEIGTRAWLQSVSVDPSRKDLVAVLKETGEPFAWAGLMHIDHRRSSAEAYLGIGDPAQWGHGFGYEIKYLLLELGFDVVGLHRIYSFNWPENHGIVAINEKLGCTVEGVLRNSERAHGEYRDQMLTAMLRPEWLAFKEEGRYKRLLGTPSVPASREAVRRGSPS